MNTKTVDIPAHKPTLEDVQRWLDHEMSILDRARNSGKLTPSQLDVCDGALGGFTKLLQYMRGSEGMALKISWKIDRSGTPQSVGYDGVEPKDWSVVSHLFAGRKAVGKGLGVTTMAVGPFPLANGERWGVVRFPDGRRAIVTERPGLALATPDKPGAWIMTMEDSKGLLQHAARGA